MTWTIAIAWRSWQCKRYSKGNFLTTSWSSGCSELQSRWRKTHCLGLDWAVVQHAEYIVYCFLKFMSETPRKCFRCQSQGKNEGIGFRVKITFLVSVKLCRSFKIGTFCDSQLLPHAQIHSVGIKPLAVRWAKRCSRSFPSLIFMSAQTNIHAWEH